MSTVRVYSWPGVTSVGAPRVSVTFWVGNVPSPVQRSPTPTQE